jgi:hypothetical protein
MALEFKRDGVSDEGTTNGSRVVVEVAAEAGAHGYGDSFTVHLAEEIARGLKQVPSVRPYLDEKGATSAEFRVRAHVCSEAGQLRLTASLLDEATGEVRAAESFSRPAGSKPFSPVEIGQAVVQMTADSLAGRNVDLPVDLLDPMDRCRYVDVVLRGSFADRSRRLAELKASINYYERLTSQDRTDIFAHRRHVGALGLFLIMAPSATLHVLPKLVAAGEAALALDSALPDVWQTIGLAHSYAPRPTYSSLIVTCRTAGLIRLCKRRRRQFSSIHGRLLQPQVTPWPSTMPAAFPMPQLLRRALWPLIQNSQGYACSWRTP